MHKEQIEILQKEANQNLLKGEIADASRKFLKAGHNYALWAESNPEIKDQLYLACVECYLNGNDMYSASTYKEMITFGNLDEDQKKVYEGFCADIVNLFNRDFHQQCTHKLDQAIINRQWHEIIAMLRDNPYLVDPIRMAELRARCCHHLGKRALAKSFSEDASKLKRWARQ